MNRPRDERHKDLFCPSLDTIIDPCHPLTRLAERIDWPLRARRWVTNPYEQHVCGEHAIGVDITPMIGAQDGKTILDETAEIARSG